MRKQKKKRNRKAMQKQCLWVSIEMITLRLLGFSWWGSAEGNDVENGDDGDDGDDGDWR